MISIILCLVLGQTPDYIDSSKSIADRPIVTKWEKIKFKGNKKSRKSNKQDILQPIDLRYRFGARILESRTKHGGKTLKTKKIYDDTRTLWMSRGCMGETDIILANIAAELDVFSEVDRLAVFLQSWHDGSETFYQAMDRVSRNGDDLFYFDDMLNEFGDSFGVDGELQDKHAALHKSFLTYRKYREFIEFVAWALVLPPSTPLPPNLSRYDYHYAGPDVISSPRHIVDIYLYHHNDDVEAVLRDLQDLITSNPLPDPLWSETYSLVIALNAKYEKEGSQIVNKAKCSISKILADSSKRRTYIAKALRLAVD